MNQIKKTICYLLLLTTTTQLFCSDSWWSQLTGYLSSWKDSISSWVRQNPGKTTLTVATAALTCYLYKQSCDEAKGEEDIRAREQEIIGRSDPFENENEQSLGKSSAILTLSDRIAIKGNIDLQMQIDDLLTTKFDNQNPSTDEFDYNSNEGEKNLNYLLTVAQNLPGMQKLTDDINLIINKAENRYNKLLTNQENQAVETKAIELFDLIQSVRNPEISISEFRSKPKHQKHVPFPLPEKTLSKVEGKGKE